MRLNAPLRRDLDGPAPDAADELMLYQILVGAWPVGLSPHDATGLEAYRDRVGAWLQKALREAKRHSGWVAPNARYEDAATAFLAGCLDPARPVCAELAAVAERLAPYAAVNSLSQTLLRLTAPGIPDLYQGTEFWDYSLVDPDNRRPVDFAAREQALAEAGEPKALLAHWRDGRVKQAVIARTLAARAGSPGLFTEGAYLPLKVEGERADHILAFARVYKDHAAIVAVTRCPTGLDLAGGLPLVPEPAWEATNVLIPRNLSGRRANSLLDADWCGILPESLPVGSLLGTLPVALLEV